MQNKVMTIKETAEYLGVTPSAVKRDARLGKLPGRKVGNQWRFTQEGLNEFFRPREFAPNANNEIKGISRKSA
jgi:excisionase family DNA binding protein